MSYVICRRKMGSEVVLLVRAYPAMTEQAAIATAQLLNKAELSKKPNSRAIYSYTHSRHFEHQIDNIQEGAV